MRLVAVSMIRNEADILPAFLGHCAALFDEVLVVDHASTDGTTQMLAAATGLMKLRAWRFAYLAYVQNLVVSALARRAFAEGADWVFPLDADEFPALGGRDALLARLPGNAKAARWHWQNRWPVGRLDFAHFDAARDYEVLDPPRRGAVKLAASRRLFEARARAGAPFGFGQGSHRLRGIAHEAQPDLGTLIHLPLRSAERFALKALNGHRANAARPDHVAEHAPQWARASGRLAAGGDIVTRAAILAPDLRASALGYPGSVRPAALRATRILRWAPLGILAGLPGGEADPGAVLARDEATCWRPALDAPMETWRLCFDGDQLTIAA
jgi:hypothetical protein